MIAPPASQSTPGAVSSAVMSSCCDPGPYDRIFTRRRARRQIGGYARRGLDSTAGPMIEVLGASLDGSVVLEVGGGSGIAQLEMLRRGAAATVCVDLSTDTADEAAGLLTRAGFAGRFTRLNGDFVDLAPEVDPADVVFLNRVVCCYPDMAALVDEAVGHASSKAAFSYPRSRWWVKLQFGFLNLLLRLRRIDFRVFVHDPEAIGERIRRAGFEQIAAATTPMWHWAIWERTAT